MQLANVSALVVAQEYLDAWNARDGSRVLASFVAGGTYSDPTAGTLNGPHIAGYVAALCVAFPDLQFEIESAGATDDDTVIARWIMRGTHRGPLAGRPPTGREIAVPGIDVITVSNGKVQSVRGYFDQKLFFEQLGLQVLLAPQSNQRVSYGVAAYARSGRKTQPGAFSTTWIDVRNEQEQAQVVEGSHRVVAEIASDPGFISWLGIIVGGRLFTATAWSDVDSMTRLMRGPAHRQGMELALSGGVGTAMHTSAWVVDHQNPLRLRCAACGALQISNGPDSHCRCGAQLPEAPPFW
jgi:steroid delta-isomerase-like uncharacterized protein